MFFRLCNSPATFQTMMNDILCPFIDRNEAVCYMDDILIYSTSLSDHRRITQDHIAMDPIKVQGVTDWPQPMKVKDVQSFIGFVNFYRRFIWNFSKITCPLHVLTRKLKNWSWGAAEQQAFDVLKNAVTSTPTLAFPSKSSLF